MKNLGIVIIGVLAVIMGKAQDGKVLESLTIESEILGKSIEYSIYLPASYDHSSRAYPVLYLLHGYTDDETAWTQFGEVQKIADAYFPKEGYTEMIIAMPDGGLDWYVNSFDGKTRYEDFFIKEFIPYIEKIYRSRAEKQFRAISGLSMGGHGTFLYALKHPEMFSSACPLSAAVWDETWVMENNQKDWNRYFGFIFGENQGEERLTEHLKSSFPYFLMKSEPAEKLKTVRWYIDCGDDDFLIEGNMDTHSILLERDIPHEFRVRDGGHSWEYWRSALPEVFKFISAGFHR